MWTRKFLKVHNKLPFCDYAGIESLEVNLQKIKIVVQISSNTFNTAI